MTSSLSSRLWVYQRERFPLAAHGTLSVVFAVGVACAGAALAGEAPRLGDLAGASVLVLGLFAQLRVADEWKDHETDREHRPERPVPRGLVTLTELTGVAVGIAVVQVVVAFALGWTVVAALALAWLWGSAMTAEFGVGEWLRTRPLVTMVSHGLIVPLIALVALACTVDGWPPGAGWILAASTFAGNVVEIGRKVRAPEDEREGVETYSAAWGPRRAGVAWALAGVFASGGAGLVLHTAGVPVWPALALALLPLIAGLAYASSPTVSRAKAVDAGAAVFTLALYLLIGSVALWWIA